MGNQSEHKEPAGPDSVESHWEAVYRSKSPEEVSWFQPSPAVSLRLIEEAGMAPSTGIIDVGGGASLLVDCLLERGFTDLSVLDVSPAALQADQERLDARATEVNWIVADVLTFRPTRTYDLWHDRACFHFMTSRRQRRQYVASLDRALAPDGTAIIATFALDGPKRCSGLDIVRYNAEGLMQELGRHWRLDHQLNEAHRTPWDAVQSFNYFLVRRA